MPYTTNKKKTNSSIKEYCPYGHLLRVIKINTINEIICYNRDCKRYISYENSFYCYICDFNFCIDCIDKIHNPKGPEHYEEIKKNVCECCGTQLGIDKNKQIKLCGGKFCINSLLIPII
jgi:hypothetical protein